MCRLNQCLITVVFCLFSAAIRAQIIATVPFQIVLGPNETILASYAFGTNAIIFCNANNSPSNIDTIYWTYNGVSFNAPMPIFLKVNPIYSGEFADPTGTLTILNTQGAAQTVECLFGF